LKTWTTNVLLLRLMLVTSPRTVSGCPATGIGVGVGGTRVGVAVGATCATVGVAVGATCVTVGVARALAVGLPEPAVAVDEDPPLGLPVYAAG
jgi:hypothetical protein